MSDKASPKLTFTRSVEAAEMITEASYPPTRGRLAVFGCLIGLCVGFAPLFTFSLGLFFDPIHADLSWSRTQIVSGSAVATFSMALVAPFVGRLMDRTGVRPVVVVSSILFPATIFCLGWLHYDYDGYLALSALIGITGAGTSPLGYLAILPGWFDRRLGLALGIASAGLGLGLVIFPLLVHWTITAEGWRNAFMTIASVAFVVGVPNALALLHDRPGAVRTRPDPRGTSGAAWSEALRTAAFWRIAGSILLNNTVVAGCALHIAALLTDRGLSVAQGAAAVSTMGAAVLVGRFFCGLLLDYVSAQRLGGTMMLGAGAGALLLWFDLSGVWPFVAAFLVGLSQGGEADLMIFLVRRQFGMRAYGAIYGTIFSGFLLGAMAGPLIMATMFDRTGTYAVVLAVFVGLQLVAAILIFGLRSRRPQ